MTDENKKLRDRALTELTVRAEMRSNHEFEDSVVIDQRATLRTPKPKKSLPPPLSYIHRFLISVPSHHRIWPLLLGMVLAAIGFAKIKGWF